MPVSNVMRCFIAIEMPNEIRGSLGSLILKIGPKSKGVRWVPVENIHITLKFFGEVKDELIPDIEKGISAVCMNYEPFNINVRGAGVFPNPKYPNVLWVGVDDSSELARLNTDIEEAMYELGFEKEDRNFSPHLTIGRVKDKKAAETAVKELYTFKDNVFGSIHVSEVLLMKSVLKPAGAEYSRISSFKLRRIINGQG